MDLINPLWTVRQLGLQAYQPVWQAMERYTESRGEHGADELWLVQHPPVYTLGQAGKREHILNPHGIEVIQCNRGGQVTYHGPGQIVAYPLVNIRRLGIGVRDFVVRIEQALIDTLAHYGISAQRRSGAPGVYVGDAKIAALGLRIRHGCSFHGLAFNVKMDTSPFFGINPCGYSGLRVTQVVELQEDVVLSEVEQILVTHLSVQLGVRPQFSNTFPSVLMAESES